MMMTTIMLKRSDFSTSLPRANTAIKEPTDMDANQDLNAARFNIGGSVGINLFLTENPP
jgi:hypothetical protein